MSENREFYEIIKEGEVFKAYRENTCVFTANCEELVQCDTALLARRIDGTYSLYLPKLVGSNRWKYEFIQILNNIEEFQYHSKSDGDNKGLLLLKIKTGNNSGYWTAMDIEFFEWGLTEKRVKTRRESLPQIPYIGDTKALIMEDFDYLPLDRYLIKIDNVIYLVDNLSGSIYSESAQMFIKRLGEIQVAPIPFTWYFKVISEEGESFYTCTHEKGCVQSFGTFYNISKTELKQYPSCYIARNNEGKILGMFWGKFEEELGVMGNETAKIVFEMPVQEAKLVEIINTYEGSIASWKLLFEDGKAKIFLCSISNKNHISKILDLSNYI